MVAPEKGEYAFTFSARKRSRPNPKYEGVLRTHRFYIEYYSLLDGQDPEKAVANNEPRISFPVGFTELVIDYAKELGGSIIKTRKVNISNSDAYYVKPIVLLANEVAFRRHLLFSITVSTYMKASSARFNAVRNLISSMNANLLNILTTMAIDRYNELKESHNPVWHWYMLRVGRAVKVLYKLD